MKMFKIPVMVNYWACIQVPAEDVNQARERACEFTENLSEGQHLKPILSRAVHVASTEDILRYNPAETPGGDEL